MNQAEKFQRLTCTQAIRNDLRARSVRAAAATWAGGAMEFILRFGSTAVLARLILPEHFGLVMMVMAVTGIADQLRDLGLSTATVQQKEITHQDVTNLFWINTLSGVFIALVVCAISPLLSLYYRDPRLTVITCILGTNFFWGGLAVQHEALLTRTLKLGQCAAVRLLANAISIVLAIALAWRGFGYWALVWREVARCALITLGLWLCFPWVPGLPSRSTSVRGLLHFGLHISGANILASICGGADRFLLGRFWGATPVAIYRQAYQLLVTPMGQLLSPIYQVAQPGLSLLQSDPDRFRQFYRKVLTVTCIAAMPVSMFVSIYSTEITRVVLGRRWADTAPILLILSFSTFITEPVGSSSFILICRGHSKRFFNLTVAQIAFTIVLMCIGARWGIKGMALANVAAIYGFTLPRLHYTFKDSPVTFGLFFSAIIRPAMASTAMSIILLVLRWSIFGGNAMERLAMGATMAPFAFLVSWILLPGGKAELHALVSDMTAALRCRRRSAQATVITSASPDIVTMGK